MLYPIEKKRVTDQVLEKVTEMILSGHFKAGDALPPDGEIASKLNVGRNSVREAMKVLQVLGVITRKQGSGTFLADADTGSINLKPLLIPLISQIKRPSDLNELRAIFENGTADIVIEKGTEENIDYIKSKNEKFIEILKSESPSINDAIQADENFHVSLAEVSENQALITLERMIFKLFKFTIEDGLRHQEYYDEMINHHDSVIDAIEKRDKNAIRKLTHDYFNKWTDEMKY